LAVTEISHAWTVSITLLLSGVYAILAILAFVSGNWHAGLAWLVQIVVITGAIYGGYLAATYYSVHDFSTVARSTVISSVANLATLPFFVFWPYIALTLRSGVGGTVNLAYLHAHRPLRLRWRFKWGEWRELVLNGLPLFVAGYGFGTLWMVVESTIVVRSLGPYALGLWTVSFMVFDAANKIPQAIVAVYKPRVNETYGRTENAFTTLGLCKTPMFLGTPAMLLMAAAMCVVIPFVVPLLMPKYVGAIPVACLMMLALPLTILELPNSLLVAMGKTKLQNIAVFGGLATFVLLTIVASSLRLGLVGIVGTSLLGKGTSLLLMYLFARSAGRLGIARST
jgi:O-antigen/teichoic acid export membrane protein